MNIFIDAEFWEDGPEKPIQLISLALVSPSGESLYVINEDFDWESCDSIWLKTNVQPMLRVVPHRVVPYKDIGNIAFKWVVKETGGKSPQFWGWYSDYDWVVFCQTFGRMIDLPQLFPKWCLDLKQLAWSKGNPELPKKPMVEHNALYDAQWNMEAHDFLRSYRRVRKQAGG